MELDVVGIGSLNYDYIYQVGSLAHGDSQVVVTNTHGAPGGSAANSIYWLSKLGATTGFIGAVGSDREGEQILEHMEETGTDISRIRKLDHKKPQKLWCLLMGPANVRCIRYPGPVYFFNLVMTIFLH